MSLDYNKKNVIIARILRKNETAQEKRLWYDFLAKRAVRFQRQKPIGDYVADFYCQKAKLIIEIDGGQHRTEEGRAEDAARTEALQRYGLRVVRFSNEQIDRDFRGVCRYIDALLCDLVEGYEDAPEP